MRENWGKSLIQIPQLYTTDGQGLYLRPYKGKGLGSRGNGLYLKQGKRITDGRGILTSIPIIGDILKAII